MQKIFQFDGKHLWMIYQRQFEASVMTGAWTEQETAAALIIAFKGGTLKVYLCLLETGQQYFNNIFFKVK